jgi:ATP-dependent RNA helicase DeaD
MLFRELGLKQGLLKSLDAMGYSQSTEIQDQVIKAALEGQNVVGQSQTGSGKTAAFLLPVLHQLDNNSKNLQALILAPTRELVVQIADEIYKLTKFYSMQCVQVYGGASPVVQKKNLQRRPAIIVATPGRLMDFMEQGVIDVKNIKYFVIDEVDRMLDMGFVRDIKKIWAQMKGIKQTLLFSATMNEEMKKIIDEHVEKYSFIKVGEEVTVDRIDHSYMAIAHEQKMYNLIKLIHDHPKDKVVVFTHTKRNTETISNILGKENITAGMLNGDMSQGKRQAMLRDFKQGKMQVLVTTDVAARGLNMENVGLVINFDVPSDAKSYIHRIGRTGRAGASGKAIMFVSPLERYLVQAIEKAHNTKIHQSLHDVQHDTQGVYIDLRLNKSTDKPGGGRSWWGRNAGPSRGGYRSNSRPSGAYSSSSKKDWGRTSYHTKPRAQGEYSSETRSSGAGHSGNSRNRRRRSGNDRPRREY